MPYTQQVLSDHPEQIPVGPGGTTITVIDGGTVYYGDVWSVGASLNQGALSAGQSATVTDVPLWVRSASSSNVSVQVGTVGTATQDVVVGSDGRVGGPGGTQLTSAVGNVISGWLPAANGSDDTTAINNAISVLTSLGVGKIRGVQGSSYKISAPIVHGSGVVVDFTGSTITLLAGGNCNMLNNAAVTATATAADAATASGSNVVTTSLGASAVVGQSCIVGAAGTLVTQPLTGLVSAKTSTTITLVKLDGVTPMNAGQTIVSGGAVALYTRDTNVTLIGGHWNMTSNAGSGTNLQLAHYRHLDGFTFKPESVTSTAGKYACSIADITNWNVEMRGINVASDGVHVTGPARGGTFYAEGTSGDDLFAVTANDWTAYADSSGDVIGVTGHVNGNSSTNLCKFIAGIGCLVDGVKVYSVTGSATLNGVWIGDDIGQPATVGGTYGDIEVDYVRANYGNWPVALFNPAGNRISLPNVINNSAVVAGNASSHNAPSVVLQLNGGSSTGAVLGQLNIGGDWTGLNNFGVYINCLGHTVQHLNIDKVYYSPGVAQPMVRFGASGNTVVNLNLGKVYASYASGPLTGSFVVGMAAGTLQFLNVEAGGYYRWVDQFFNGYLGQTGTTTIRFGAANVRQSNKLAGVYNTVNVLFDGLSVDTLNSQAIFFDTGSSGTITGIAPTVLSGTFTLFTRTASQSVRVNGPTLQCDPALLTPSAGDLAYNSNSATAPGLGVVEYNGAAWVQIAPVSSGVATLAAGTSGAIANASVTANSRIRTHNTSAGGAVGALSVALNAGVGFTINSTSGTDTSKVLWEIVQY